MNRLDSLCEFYHELLCFIRNMEKCQYIENMRETPNIEGYQQRIIALFHVIDHINSFNSTEVNYLKQKFETLELKRKPKNLSIFF
jgi:hypothetical protein